MVDDSISLQGNYNHLLPTLGDGRAADAGRRSASAAFVWRIGWGVCRRVFGIRRDDRGWVAAAPFITIERDDLIFVVGDPGD
jgi:hypothetical protein